MKKLNYTQMAALERIRESKGRFFGLYTTQGSVYNAQFLGESDNYIRFFDRNNFEDRKIAKSSLKKVSLG